MSNGSVGKMFEGFGDVAQWGIPIFSLGCGVGKDRIKEAILFLPVAVIQQIAIDSIKHLTQRTRPNGLEESFPSGHTTAAFFGLAFYLAVSRNREPSSQDTLVSITVFALSVLTGLSRHTSRSH